jgi:two-component sensor histidine kinase
LVETALAPYRSKSERCRIEGADLPLAARMAVPLGLVLHELATNAVKYGAWSGPGGTVSVSWRRDGGRVRLVWREQGQGELAAPQREGFGTMLMASSARQMSGTIERTFHPDGIEVRIEFPET